MVGLTSVRSLPKPPLSWVFNKSKDRDPAASLDYLLQCLTTPTVKTFFLSLSYVWPWWSLCLLSWHRLQCALWRFWLHFLYRLPWNNKETSETLMSLFLSTLNQFRSISFSHYVLQPAKCSGGFTLQFFNIFGSTEVCFSHFFFFSLRPGKANSSHEMVLWQFLCNILSLGLWQATDFFRLPVYR